MKDRNEHNQKKGKNRRSRFRLRLPGETCLRLTMFGMEYEVVEIAEKSLVVSAEHVVSRGGRCVGEIYWSDGTCTKISGEVGRLSNLGRVIFKIKQIETRHIVKEQRRLLNKFPTLNEEVNNPLEIFKPESSQ